MGRGTHESENSIALSSRRATQENGQLTSKSWLTNRLLEERLAASKAEYWLSAEADAQAAVFMRTATIGSTVMLLPDSYSEALEKLASQRGSGRLASPLRRGYDLVTFTLGDTAGVDSREDGEV